MKNEEFDISQKLQINIAVVVIILVGATYKLVYLEEVEGTVSHKSVSGIKGDTFYGIILNRPISNGSWIVVKDEDYMKYFSGRHAVINETRNNCLFHLIQGFKTIKVILICPPCF